MKFQFIVPFTTFSGKFRCPPAAFLFILVLVWLTGCTFVPDFPPSVPVSVPQNDLRGGASWYGHPFHGRKTSNGETFNMHAFTAAHRTLPFGSWVRVQRLDNGNSVDVRINDRGPFVDGRIIDLSRAAAGRLGILSSGVASVRLIPLRVPPAGSSQWFVLIGEFPNRNIAQAFAARMRRYSRKSKIIRGWNGNPRHYHVQLDGFRSKKSAVRLASRLRRKGYRAFIVRFR